MKNKTIVIGDNYISSAFAGTYEIWKEYPVVLDHNDYGDISTIIYCIDDKTNNIRHNWQDNYKQVYDLFEFGQKFNIKIVYISTAELYGNNWDWEYTVEDCKVLDINTDYRLSKRVAERFLENSNALILRIKNPFDGRASEENTIVRNLKKAKIFNWQDSYTYLPDLVDVCKFLIDNEHSGIFNMVQTKVCSIMYMFKNLLGLPRYSSLDGDDPENTDFNNHQDVEEVHADVNSSKINNMFALTDLHAAVIISWESLKNGIDKSLYDGSIPYGQ